MDFELLQSVVEDCQDPDPSTHAQEIECLRQAVDKWRSTSSGSSSPPSPVQRVLEPFVFYVFERRFGWSESSQSQNLQASDLKWKSTLNSYLDEVLQLLKGAPVSTVHISAISRVTHKTDKPVVREQAFRFFFDWIAHHTQGPLEEQGLKLIAKNFDGVQDTIVRGLTDVWSAVRKKCSRKLFSVAEVFTMDQVSSLFGDLVVLCASSDSSWQQKEGAMLGITVIIKRFQSVRTAVHGPPGTTASVAGAARSAGRYLAFGNLLFPSLPPFLSDGLDKVAHAMLAHPQLSIRDQTMQAMAAVFSRSSLIHAQHAFFDIIGKLQDPGPGLLGAYEAEGLLSVCEILVSYLPCRVLLTRWAEFAPILLSYLAHPASTVRQKASATFARLVSRSSKTVPGSPQLLARLVLQTLAAEWPAPVAARQPAQLLQNHVPVNSRSRLRSDVEAAVHSSLPPSLPLGQNQPEESTPRADPQRRSWEWREGRLLALELILERLARDHKATLAFPAAPSRLQSPMSRHASKTASSSAGSRGSVDSHGSGDDDLNDTGNQSLTLDDRAAPRSNGPPSPFSVSAIKPFGTPGSSGPRPVLEPCQKHQAGPTALELSSSDLQRWHSATSPSSTSSAQLPSKTHGFSTSVSMPNLVSAADNSRTQHLQYGHDTNKSLRNLKVNFLSPLRAPGPRRRRNRAMSWIDRHEVARALVAVSGSQDSVTTKPPVILEQDETSPTASSGAPRRLSSAARFDAKLLSLSLLQRMYLLDRRCHLFGRSSDTHTDSADDNLLIVTGVHALPLPRPPVAGDSNDSNKNKSALFFSSSPACPECQLEESVKALHCVPFGEVLQHMLLQTVACSYHTRWELRRMADQVLPHLLQVLCFYDVELHHKMNAAYLKSSSTFLHCSAALAIKYMLRTVLDMAREHAVDLPPPATDSELGTTHAPEHKGTDSERVFPSGEWFALACADGTDSSRGAHQTVDFIVSMYNHLPETVRSVYQLSQDCASDKVVTVCSEILLLLYACFAHTGARARRDSSGSGGGLNASDAWQERVKHAKFVCGRLLLTRKGVTGQSTEDVYRSSTFRLSVCSPVPQDSDTQVSKPAESAVQMLRRSLFQRVEQWFLTCTHVFLPDWVRALPLAEALSAVPILLDYIQEYEDGDIALSVLGALERVLAAPVAYLADAARVRVDHSRWEKLVDARGRRTHLEVKCELMVTRLTEYLDGTLPVTHLRKALDVLAAINLVFCDLRFLPSILIALGDKLSECAPVANMSPIDSPITPNSPSAAAGSSPVAPSSKHDLPPPPDAPMPAGPHVSITLAVATAHKLPRRRKSTPRKLRASQSVRQLGHRLPNGGIQHSLSLRDLSRLRQTTEHDVLDLRMRSNDVCPSPTEQRSVAQWSPIMPYSPRDTLDATTERVGLVMGLRDAHSNASDAKTEQTQAAVALNSTFPPTFVSALHKHVIPFPDLSEEEDEKKASNQGNDSAASVGVAAASQPDLQTTPAAASQEQPDVEETGQEESDSDWDDWDDGDELDVEDATQLADEYLRFVKRLKEAYGPTTSSQPAACEVRMAEQFDRDFDEKGLLPPRMGVATLAARWKQAKLVPSSRRALEWVLTRT